MAVYTFNDNLQIFAPKHIDTRYINLFTPWASPAAANAGIPSAYRYLGLTVLIGVTEWWYQAGITDPDLVPKVGGVTSVTADNLLTETGANIQLGGTILHDTLLDITGTNFKLYINGDSNSVSPFIVSSTGTAPSMTVQNSNITGSISILSVVSTNGTAVRGNSGATGVSIYGFNNSNGIGGYFNATTAGGAGVSILANSTAQPLIVNSELQPSFFQVTTVSNAGVTPIIQLVRQSSTGGAPTVGIGGSIEFYNRMSNGSSQISNTIESSFTNVTTGSVDSKLTFRGVNASSQVDKFIISAPATIVYQTRFEEAMGAAVASANSLTLGVDGNLFSITGAVQINAITIANWQAGSEVAFILASNPTLKHNTAGGGGTAPLFLAGGIDFVAAAGDYIAFKYDGTYWRETTRRQAGGGSAGVFSANNGLTLSTPSNVQWGGTLIHDTTVNGSTFHTIITGTNGLSVLEIDNTGFGHGITSFASNGDGIQASGQNGGGGGQFSTDFGNAITGNANQVGGTPIQTNTTPNNTTSIDSVYAFQRSPSGGIGAVGEGLYGLWNLPYSTGGLIGAMRESITATDVGAGTFTAQYALGLRVNDAIPIGGEQFILSGNGALQLSQYGVGTFTGTATRNLAVDSTGHVIEVSIGTTGVITVDNGLTLSTATNAQWGGTLVHNTTITQGGSTITFSGQSTGSMISMSNVVVGAATQRNTLDVVSAAVFGGSMDQTAIKALAGGTNSGVNIGGVFEGTMGTGGGISAYGIYATSDLGIGVYGGSLSNIGVLGILTSGSGGTAVFGDASNTDGTGVNGTGGLSGIGGSFDSGGGIPLLVLQNQTGNNNIVTGIEIHRAGAASSGGLYGTSILFKLNNTGGVLKDSTEIISSWNIGTAGNEYSFLRFQGVSAGGTLQPWVDINNQTANFLQTGGSSIVAVGGSLGATLTGTVTGLLSTGVIPIWACNPSTVTNTVVDGILIQRNGTYNGAAGVGIQIRFESKNDVGTITTSGTISNQFTTTTAGAVVGQFDFKLAIAATIPIIMSICGRNGGVVNEPTVQNFASNAAAISGGLFTGDHYRNGDNLCIVH